MINRTVILILSAVVLSCASCASALAEGVYKDQNELRLVSSVMVDFVDGVKHGCLPRPAVLKAEAELILRRSGTAVVDQDAGSILSINATGFFVNGACVARLDITLYRHATTPEGHAAVVIGYDDGTVLTAPRSRLQENLRIDVSAIVTDLANEIVRARTQ